MSEVKTYITKEKIIANYQLQIDALLKENEEVKLALFDRSEKYKIAMDKGVLQLGDEIKSLRTSLKLAVEWIEKETDCQRLSFRHVRPCSRCDLLEKIQAKGEL